MDTNSLLVLIIGLLTLNLLFVGVYIVLVLKEVRESVRKANEILDSAAKISASVAEPIVGVSGMLSGFMQGLRLLRGLNLAAARKEEEDE